MTQSDNDHEALTALRIAQDHIKKAGLSWEQLIQVKTKTSKYTPISDTYDSGYFKVVVECKEYTSLLNQNQVEWYNKVIRFKNKHGFIPEETWSNIVNDWNEFRKKH